ncbi:MAG TPA: NADH-quinone oxidoreductase subunit H [Halomonas sp.]|nr:NADH-quinone oxidoreductase subunit H [Halomonas sp.]
MILAAFSLLVALPALIWAAAVFDRVGTGRGATVLGPLCNGAALMLRPNTSTEAPDALNRLLAPGWYLALALIGLSVVPLAPGIVASELSTGLVLWGACEALTVVVVFLHGWSPNSPLPLIGAYRYVAIGLPAMLLSMFVLIAAALPAQSLSVVEVVEAQRGLWNVIRQPLGLPLFMGLGLAVTLRGPLDYADGAELAGGTSAEESGPALALWQFARLAMLVAFSAMAASVFLGGYLGPGLPGPVWLLVKTVAVMAATVAAGRWFARTPPARMLTFLWVILLPLSFANLALVGLEVLP